MRHMVRIQVSAELIAQVLGMPAGTNIPRIVPHDDIPGVFVLYAEHPDLPEVPEAMMPPETTPILTVDYDKRPETWLTFDWGLPKSD